MTLGFHPSAQNLSFFGDSGEEGEYEDTWGERWLSCHKSAELPLRHFASRRGQELLANWAQSRSRFVKVFPKEYRRALGEMKPKSAAATQPAKVSA